MAQELKDVLDPIAKAQFQGIRLPLGEIQVHKSSTICEEIKLDPIEQEIYREFLDCNSEYFISEKDSD